MKQLSPLLAFVLFTGLCSQSIAQDRPFGENLLQTLPLPVGEWDVFSDKEGTDVRWIEKSDREMVQTKVMRGAGSRAGEYKALDIAAGQKHCAVFNAEVLFEGMVNGYEAVLWRSDCERSNKAASAFMHLALAGKDAYYLVKKAWQFKPTDENAAIWLKYMRSISLCDTRSSAHPCPELKSVPFDKDLTGRSR